MLAKISVCVYMEKERSREIDTERERESVLECAGISKIPSAPTRLTKTLRPLVAYANVVL